MKQCLKNKECLGGGALLKIGAKQYFGRLMTLYLDPLIGHFIWTLYLDALFGHFIWTLYLDALFGRFILTLYFDALF